MTLTVVGIGADGWEGLPSRAREVVIGADIVVGGARHLDLLPEEVAAQRREWPSPLREGLPGLFADLGDRRVVALASGDPFLSGIGTTLVDVLGADAIDDVIPAVSSVALARAAMRWSAEHTTWVSLVGRDAHRILRYVEPGARLLVLVADGTTATRVAAILTEEGFGESELTALSELGGPGQSRRTASARTWHGTTPNLTVLAIECRGAGRWWSRTPGLPDEAFDHDGQLTKRDIRASALARLAPRPGELLWDVGAGAGSVAIEWMRAHPRNRAVAIERDPVRAARIRRNAARLGVPELEVVEGAAPEALKDLQRPEAIFVGGAASRDGVLDACWEALVPAGRLVVHGVTVETESLLVRWHEQHEGGELTRLHVEQLEPLGAFSGWTPSRAVTQWAATRR
ncbi:precorrin-6y C5,15-methyltransferase (decarboxylating) subunit CbiE [uncultured Aeromicrobium sp.]|uniref:precorrin-6y C5,15-methyltransferase (decarboxylating) subunit CbiE n=1 Tax=uncultured Aeromicrobium sp. TaxID=337820 RepID=UPI0025F5E5FC|nr:precorrin-6y C5,15-methyltransferase (decarboxylating) subunit CbiE [uncultured Aeromicrobium sp.]